MKWVVRILLILVLLAVAAGAAGFLLLPKSVLVERTAVIERPPHSVSAWLATIPAKHAFTQGVTETVQTLAENRVESVIDLGKGRAQMVYELTPSPTGVSVKLKATRQFGGDLMARLDAASGKDGLEAKVDAGFTALTAELNALPTFDFSGLQYSVEDVTARPYIFLEASTKQAAVNIKNAMRQSLPLVRTAIETNNLKVAGPPIAVETNWADGRYEFRAGLPYSGDAPELFGVKVGSTPAGRVLKVTYMGTEENVIPTYDQIESLIAASRLKRAGPSFEIYLDDPTQESGSVKREIYYLIEGDDAALAKIPTAK